MTLLYKGSITFTSDFYREKFILIVGRHMETGDPAGCLPSLLGEVDKELK
jgi:hypothetical protein